MATNTYFFPNKAYPAGFDFNPSLGQLLIFQGRTVVSQDSDQQILELTNGLNLKLIGSGFSYDAQGQGTGGTLTSLQLILNNEILQTLTAINLDFQEFYDHFRNGAQALAQWLMSGVDTINGSSGKDDLVGGDGNDALTGNGGNDSFNGGDGADSYSGGDGIDTLSYESGYSDPNIINGVSINAATQVASDQYGNNNETFNTMEAFRGTRHNDVMVGASAGPNVANESFMGLGGADDIDGGAGIDEVRYDRDSVRGGNNGITVDLTPGGQAIDGFGDQDTLANIENVRGTRFSDTIIGSAAGNNLRGFGGSDTLNGDAGIDILWGGDGNDTLNGGVGPDTMKGEAGSDVYVVDNASDIVDESIFGSNGIDTVRSSFSFNLANTARVLGAVENLTLLGTGNINGTGNALNNVINGNSGANILRGGAGNDTLIGGVGADDMRGGAGNDIYSVNNASDIVNETGWTGLDTVRSSISFNFANTARVLGSVENLTLLGLGNINGTGNGLNNAIRGNDGSNVLIGAAGNDALIGGGGADKLTGGAGNDTINGGAGNDRLTGSAGNDHFIFNTAISAAFNVDTIVDFNVVQDTTRLDNAVMSHLGSPGTLSSAAFWKSTSGAAHDGNDRIIYETDTGKLFYDSNGSTAGGSTHIATLSVNLALTYADFLVI